MLPPAQHTGIAGPQCSVSVQRAGNTGSTAGDNLHPWRWSSHPGYVGGDLNPSNSLLYWCNRTRPTGTGEVRVNGSSELLLQDQAMKMHSADLGNPAKSPSRSEPRRVGCCGPVAERRSSRRAGYCRWQRQRGADGRDFHHGLLENAWMESLSACLSLTYGAEHSLCPIIKK